MRPVLWRLASALTGGMLGFVYAEHVIARKIAQMREQWGWVCGTGLDMPLYVWPTFGAIAGTLVALAIPAVRRRLMRWTRKPLS